MLACSSRSALLGGCVAAASRAARGRIADAAAARASFAASLHALRVPPNGCAASRFYSDAAPQSPYDAGRHRVFTVPNALCVFRMGITPLIGALVVEGALAPALGLFAVASATDMADGWIARNVPGQSSLLGSVLDPMADKLLVGTLFVTTTYAGLVPLPLTAIVLLRDVCLIVGGFWKRYRTMAPPITLSRFFDSRVSSMQVVPTMVSKVNTLLQVAVVTLALVVPLAHGGPAMQHAFVALCCATGGTTVWSGLQYASGRAFKKV